MNTAKFYVAKIAFEIPEKYEVEGHIIRAIPDELVDRLMDLFGDCEFESANICSPPLIIVNTTTVTPKWIAKSKKRINAVLRKYLSEQAAT